MSYKNDAQKWLDNGLSHWDNGEKEEALQYFNRAIEIEPDFAPAYLQRGALKTNMGQYRSAILDYEEGLKYAENIDVRGSLLFNILLCKLEMGNLDGFYSALEIAANNDESWNVEKLINKKFPGYKTIIRWLENHPDKATEVKKRINEIIAPDKI